MRRPWRSITIDELTIARLGVAISLLFIALQVARLNRAIYLIPGLLSLGSCLTWLYLRKKDYNEPTFSSRTAALISATLFFILFIASMIILQTRAEVYSRPLIFFIIISSMSGLLMIEILYASRRFTPLILAQIILLALTISWSQLFLFPAVVGGDSWWHQFFTNTIIAQGHVPGELSYTNLPLFHILIGSFSIISSTDYKIASLLTVSLMQLALQAALVFLMAREAFGNYRVGLISALFVSFSIYGSGMSLAPNPTAMAFTLVLLVIFLLMKRQNVQMLSLVTLLIITIVLIHSITSICLIIVLAVGLMASKIPIRGLARARGFASPAIVLFSMVAMFAWWAYVSGHIAELAALLRVGFSRDYFLGQGPIEQIFVPAFEEIFNLISMFIFFAIGLIGVLYSISKRGSRNAAIVGSIGVVLLLIGLVSLITGRGLVEQRWWYYALVVLTIPLGAALFIIWSLATRRARGRWSVTALFAIFTGLLTMVSILSPVANIDNPVLSPHTSIPIAYTEGEITGASFFSTNANDTIGSDYAFSISASSSPFLNYYHYHGKGIISLDSAIKQQAFTSNGTVLIIRTNILEGPFNMERGPYMMTYDLERLLLSSDLSKIYTDGAVSGYI